jgi:hypothetical protein
MNLNGARGALTGTRRAVRTQGFPAHHRKGTRRRYIRNGCANFLGTNGVRMGLFGTGIAADSLALSPHYRVGGSSGYGRG